MNPHRRLLRMSVVRKSVETRRKINLEMKSFMSISKQ